MMQQTAMSSTLAKAAAPTHHRARSSGGLGERVPPFSPSTQARSHTTTEFPKPRASLPSTLPLDNVASAPQFLEPETSKLGFLYCRKNCGFYGSPKWNGYCSKCYKHVARQPSVSDDSGEEEGGKHVRLPPAPTTPSKSDISSSFWGAASSVRFMVKETIQTLKGEQRRELTRTKADFKAIMKDSSVQDIVVKVKTFINWMLQQDDFTPQEQVDQIHRFMQDITQRVVRHPTFRGAPVDELEWVIDGMERHILNKLYRSIFANEADRKKDEYLQDKMEGLQWVTCPMLVGTECGIDETDANHELFDLARQELVKMNSKRPPMDKLQCVTSCCQAIQRALATMLTRPASADEFLPVLIYVVITANPPCLHSNLQYVQQYGKMSRLASGEEGYYFTNLCGAVSFLENMDHTHMEMPKDVYDRKVTLQRVQNVGRNVSECPTVEEIEQPLSSIELESATTITDLMLSAEALRQSQAQLWGSMSRMQQDMKALGWRGPVAREASLGGVSVPHVDIHTLSATPSGSTDGLSESAKPTSSPPHTSYADVVKRGEHASDHESQSHTQPQEKEISDRKSPPPTHTEPAQETPIEHGSNSSDLMMHGWAKIPAVMVEPPSNRVLEPPSPSGVVYGHDSIEEGLTDTDSTCSSASPWAQRAPPKPRRRSRLSTSSLGSATEASEYFAGECIEGESDDGLETIQSSGDGEDVSTNEKPPLVHTDSLGNVAISGESGSERIETGRADVKGGKEECEGKNRNGEGVGSVDSNVNVSSVEKSTVNVERASINIETVNARSRDSGDANTDDCVYTNSEVQSTGSVDHEADGLYGLHTESGIIESAIRANSNENETPSPPSASMDSKNGEFENKKNECVGLDSDVPSASPNTESAVLSSEQNGNPKNHVSENGVSAPCSGDIVEKGDVGEASPAGDGADTCGHEFVFKVKCNTQPGQTVVLSGSPEELGCWQADRAVRLSCPDYPLWSVTLKVASDTFEYKYALAADSSPDLIYEDGPNRKHESGNPLETIDVFGQPRV